MRNSKLRTRLAAVPALFFAFNFLMPPSAYAWGPEGHQVVALIAADNLSPKAKAAVDQILGGRSMDVVANWADDYRESHPETANWHFVDIPLNANTYRESRDCKNTNKQNEVKGDCAIDALKYFEQVVVDTNQTAGKRFMALKYIIHFVGDIHQPLHSADNHDRGGNGFKVKWFNQKTDLHKVWDGKIIGQANLSSRQYASRLEAGLTDAQKDEIEQGSLEDWVNESHRLAKPHAYDSLKMNASLGDDYYQNNKPVVEEQLLRGGLRLAKVLNDLFK